MEGVVEQGFSAPLTFWGIAVCCCVRIGISNKQGVKEKEGSEKTKKNK